MALFLPQITRGVSVLDFGADPNGNVDSTTAFNDALTATNRSDPIRIPSGLYLIDGNAVNLASRMWIGDVGSAGRSTTILRARTATQSFMAFGSRTYIENIVFDANFLCDFALRMNSAHNTTLVNVDCRNANDAALFSDQTNIATTVRLTCRLSANGARFIGANGMVIIDTRLLDNDGFGMEFFGNRSGVTAQSGQMSLFGFLSARNGGDGVQVHGVTNGTIAGGQIEDNGGHGIVLDDGAANILVDGMSIAGDGSSGEVAIDVVDALICTFRGIKAAGAVGSYERVRIQEPSQVMQVYGARNSAGDPLDLDYTNGVSTYTANPDGANLKATSVPTRGQFRRGHIAWNGAPTAGSNRGWRCTVAGTPGTWSSF